MQASSPLPMYALTSLLVVAKPGNHNNNKNNLTLQGYSQDFFPLSDGINKKIIDTKHRLVYIHNNEVALGR